MLTVILIIGILAGTSSFVYGGLADQSQSPEKEAQRLARWLTNLATISNRTGRSFRLYCPGNNIKRSFVEATWLNPMQKDVYNSAYDCQFTRFSSANADSTYSPQWNALVPTLTVEVSLGKARHYVIVSQSGRVRTSASPP